MNSCKTKVPVLHEFFRTDSCIYVPVLLSGYASQLVLHYNAKHTEVSVGLQSHVSNSVDFNVMLFCDTTELPKNLFI